MKKLLVILALIAAGVALFKARDMGSGPEITADEVIVATGQMDVYFTRLEPFAETYMVFGGLHMPQKNAISKVSLSALSMRDARAIYATYPDFRKCKSPGAVQAQEAVLQMNIVPSDSDVLEVLKEALVEHGRSLQQGGESVCVRIQGVALEMAEAIIRGSDEDILDQLPSQLREDYYLVQSADIVDALTALGAG